MASSTGALGAGTLASGTLSSMAAATFPMARGPAVYSTAAKIGLYRECINLANTIKDEPTKAITLKEIRNKWREQRGHGGMSLEVSLASALDRVSYLRMCTPKHTARKVRTASLDYDWDVQNPMENHEKVLIKRREEQRDEPMEQAHGKGRRDFVPKTNWGPGNIDPDAVKKHKELTDRQYFMGPHWRGKPKPLIYEDLSFEEQMQAHFAPPPITPKRVRKRY